MDGNRIYYYEKEDSKGSERSAGIINLEYYDACSEATPKEVRKATNVFVISTSDKSFFDSGRYYFSAETLSEMNEWMNKIRATMEHIQTSRKRGKGGGLSKSASRNPDIAKESSGSDLEGPVDICPDVIRVSDVPRESQLQCVTKTRPRGPRGRRLPNKHRSVNPILPSSQQQTTTATDQEHDDVGKLWARASSLSALESNLAESRLGLLEHNRDMDLSSVDDDLDAGDVDDVDDGYGHVRSSSTLEELRRFDRAWFLRDPKVAVSIGVPKGGLGARVSRAHSHDEIAMRQSRDLSLDTSDYCSIGGTDMSTNDDDKEPNAAAASGDTDSDVSDVVAEVSPDSDDDRDGKGARQWHLRWRKSHYCCLQ